ncbi:unnamed protein product [Rangifer tarandus platyrhynchus]|uniref:Uncharacterized protein n=1 Tax=Rangifer tarandus platyrhynchus TaxID=3082113 RepID=A0AC59Z7M7_RANTA
MQTFKHTPGLSPPSWLHAQPGHRWVAGKQLRVAGRERALPPPANFRPPQRKQELVNHKPKAKGELRSLGATSRPAAASRNVRGCLDLGLPLPGKGSSSFPRPQPLRTHHHLTTFPGARFPRPSGSSDHRVGAGRV